MTSDLPGIGGRLKLSPEDFVVEEIPAYEPCGEGEHLFLWIEKRDLSAEQLTRHISRTLNVSNRDIGVAGLKDRRAVTRQYVSVPSDSAENIGSIENESLRILRSARHTNKLRTGHLKGNRFEILVRFDPESFDSETYDSETSGSENSVESLPLRPPLHNGGIQALRPPLHKGGIQGGFRPERMEIVQQIAARITNQGFPNYYGPQRFGREGETLTLGYDLLRGIKTPGDLPRSRRRYLLRFALSAVQSDLFNQALAARLADGLLNRVLEGDVMQVRQTGGIFVAEDAAAEQQRFENREIAITGPLFGIKMRKPQGDVFQREFDLLAKNRLTFDLFRSFKKLMPGTRRPYMILPEDFCFEVEPAGIRFGFILPSGAYATTLLREFMKNAECN